MNYLEICNYVFAMCFASVYGEYVVVSLPRGKVEECGRSKYDVDNFNTSGYATARLGQFPWTVRIGSNEDDDNITFFCGGSLITNSYVITEAHCGKLGHVVRVGEYNIEEEKDCDECGVCAPPAQDIKVVRRLYGSDCSSQSRERVMIMELEQPVEFNDFVRPICVPTQKTCEESVGQGHLVTPGWGQVNPTFLGSSESDTFKEMVYASPRVASGECLLEDMEDDYCMVFPSNQRTGQRCVGDSGGPLVGYQKEKGVNRAYLVGVAKYHPPSCEIEDTPLEYSSMCKLSDWIITRIQSSAMEGHDD